MDTQGKTEHNLVDINKDLISDSSIAGKTYLFIERLGIYNVDGSFFKTTRSLEQKTVLIQQLKI